MVAHRAELVEELTPSGSRTGTPVRRGGSDDHDRNEDVKDTGDARKALARVSRMVTDLLDTERIQQGMFDIRLKRFELTALARVVAQVLTTPGHPIEVAAAADVR
jgi:K+-sensing histidine kinase KdpD